MTDAVLRNRLLATVPALDDPDWLDVRRRAAGITAKRRNRRLVAIAAVLAVLTALVVNPALGIGERLLEFVEGDPAPESVKRRLADGAQPPPPLRIGRRVIERPSGPQPDLIGARLAVVLDSSIGRVYLWAVPTDDRRGTCVSLQLDGRPSTAGQCGAAPTRELPIVATGAGGARFGDETLNYIRGQARRDVARLEVALSDGRVSDLRLVDGFFLAEIPSTVSPVEYRGFDAAGSLVARVRVPERRPPRRIQPIEPYREVISITLLSGREARLEYARAERETVCWRLFWGAQSSGTCSPILADSLPSAMSSGTGRNQTVLLQGPVGSDIARVDLVWDDGTVERLRVEDGFVLRQIDPYGKRLPSKLVGRDEQGQIVRERSAFGPG